jgi:hypothetical protein
VAVGVAGGGAPGRPGSGGSDRSIPVADAVGVGSGGRSLERKSAGKRVAGLDPEVGGEVGFGVGASFFAGSTAATASSPLFSGTSRL